MISGLPSTGVDVCDLQSVPIPVARYFTYASNAAGGIHVRLSPNDSRMADIQFFDERGLNISTSIERKIESIFFREDFRRVYLDEIGRITYGRGVAETYIEAFLSTLHTEALENLARLTRGAPHPNLVVDYGHVNGSDVLPTILRRLKIDVVELNANLDENRIVQTTAELEASIHRLTQIIPVLEAQMGVRIDGSGVKIVLVDNTGRRIPSMQALAAVVSLVLHAHGGGKVAVPVTAPRAFEKLADYYGGTVLRTKTAPGALMQTALEHPDLLLLGDGAGSYIFPSFHPIADGLYAIIKILELLIINDTTLSTTINDLPPYHLKQAKVPCRWESKGKVMRMLNEQYQNRTADNNIDGVKIDLGSEWVLILPDPDSPFFHVIAEGNNEEQAFQLTDKYAELVATLQ
jgi:mannose-1-phosphate guanylyltransferase/phosphomannomutase